MMRQLRTHLSAGAVAILLALFPAATKAATPEQVQRAIDKAQKFLLDHRKPNGTWEEVDKPETGTDEALRVDVKGRQWGGLTAISTYALLASGKDWRDKELAPAIDFLLKANIEGTYALGMSSQLAIYLPPQKTRLLVKHNVGMLGNGLFMPPRGVNAINWSDNVGFYSYWTGTPEGSDQTTFNPNARNFGTPQNAEWYDRSASQYGVLGMWALERAGGDIPRSYWTIVDTAWKRAQNDDGGWNYRQGDDRTASMTAAGIATLYITQDYTLQRNWGACTGGVKNAFIEHGLDWIDKHIDEAVNGSFYTLYGIERIGAASGRRYFGNKDWFDLGAEYLLSKQHEDGSWEGDRGTIPDTCFALLFLARGRAPVFMNKLQYESQDRNPLPDVWDERPRDVANLAAWVGRQQETFFNWQVVNFDVPPEALHDAPILYISGSRALNFKDEEKKTLRAFVEGGGMILGNADCNSGAFATSFTKLGKELFPAYDFRQTSPNDLIWREQFTQFRTKPKVMELTNGVRKLMVLFPDSDPARAWQMRTDKSREAAFELAANLFLYATDKQNGANRGAGYFATAAPTTQTSTATTQASTAMASTRPASRPARPIQVARLILGPNPDPEPGGWTRLAKILWRTAKIDLSTKSVPPANLSGFKIAHLTGTGSFSFDAKSRAALKSFITSGGTLIVDSAGGDSAFADSMQTELETMFGAGKLELLLPDHALYAKSEFKLDEPYFRRFALDHVADRKHFQLRGITLNKRIAVFFSREDLSAGLVGEEVDGINGYTPANATALMAAVLTYVK